ncbi:MAG: hypothetical protein ISR65_19015 [Bacteriovoracaceae bacterium]|nr:hypothetical protein [Bacteriovoracaceae bacterium]
MKNINKTYLIIFIISCFGLSNISHASKIFGHKLVSKSGHVGVAFPIGGLSDLSSTGISLGGNLFVPFKSVIKSYKKDDLLMGLKLSYTWWTGDANELSDYTVSSLALMPIVRYLNFVKPPHKDVVLFLQGGIGFSLQHISLKYTGPSSVFITNYSDSDLLIGLDLGVGAIYKKFEFLANYNLGPSSDFGESISLTVGYQF